MPGWVFIAAKDLRLLLRDRGALFWVVAFPLLFATFFGSILKAASDASRPAMTVAVVGDPGGGIEAALGTALERAGLTVRRLGEAEARGAVQSGELLAFVRISPEGLDLAGDPSRGPEVALFEAILAAASHGAASGEPPVSIRRLDIARAGAVSSDSLVFPAMILWGLLGCAAAFAVSIVAERVGGTLVRLRAAPITNASILGGKAAACALACFGDALLLTGVALVFLAVPIEDPVKLLAAITATTVCFVGLTMVLGVFGESEHAVAGAGWATLVLFAMLGGAMVPLRLFPEWLLSASDLSPVKWGILALEGATWRGLDWAELAKPLLILASFGVGTFALGVGVLMASSRSDA